MHSEDDDFSPYPSSNSGKKLASLFEKSNATTKGGNSSLMYKAPKQPKPQQQQSRSSQSVQPASQSQPQSVSDSSLNLILLKVVQTFRLENNEYKTFGKLGAAILGNYNTNQFQLLLYKEKKNIISQTTINSQFWFTVQPNNYATFYDKHKVMWTILFDKTDNAIEFNSQIAIIKWCCSDKQSAIVTQDLVVNESKKLVEAEDSVEVSYTITVLLSSNELDKVVETVNSVVITPSVASDSEDGTKIWESTLIGASEGTKKLIILPTSRLGRWKKFIPNDNCSLVLNVHIHSIKDKSDLMNTLPKSSSANLDSSTDQSIKVKSDLIADALSSSPKSSSPKASILSRMAKMGLPTLPFKGARVATIGLSDSDDTTEDDPLSASSSSDSRKKSNTTDNVKQIDSLKQVPLPSIQQSSIVSSQPQVLPSNPPTVNIATAATMFNPQHIVTNSDSNISMVTTPRTIMFDSNLIQPTSSATSVVTSTNCSAFMDPQLPVFLSELRTHNCELRMNINRVTDKIDKVLDKVDNSDPMDKILENLHLLEQKIILQFSQINQRNKEVNDLIMGKTAKNMSLPSGSFKEKTSSDPVEQLKTENCELSSAVSQSKIKIDELQEKLKKLVITKSHLEKKLENEKKERIKFEEEHQYLINVLKLKITEQKDAVNFWQLSVEKVTDKISDLEKTVEKTSKNIRNTDEEIKTIMQNVFKRLLERFPKDSCVYNSSVIHRSLAEIIKASTFEYLESQKPSSTDVSISESSGRLSGGDSLETVNKESSTSSFTEPDSKSCNDETTKEAKVTFEDNTENIKDKNTTCNLSENLSHSDKTNDDNEKLNLIIESKEIPSITDFDISNAELPDIKDVDSSKSVKDEFNPDKKSESNPVDNINKSTSKVTKEATDTTGIFVRNREQSSSSSSSMTNDANDENWRSQPPPLLFDDEEKDMDDDWLKM